MKVDLPTPGVPDRPMRRACGPGRRASSSASASARWSARRAFDQRDRAGQRPAVTGADQAWRVRWCPSLLRSAAFLPEARGLGEGRFFDEKSGLPMHGPARDKRGMADLPVTAILPELAAALAGRGMAVLQAPPGAGKTTVVPLDLLARGIVAGRILMLEPRRLAARAAAERMAETLGEPVGRTVGYRIRGEAKVSAATRIEVVTEGILTRMIQSDPELGGHRAGDLRRVSRAQPERRSRAGAVP